MLVAAIPIGVQCVTRVSLRGRGAYYDATDEAQAA
jgi:hypothetical protein